MNKKKEEIIFSAKRAGVTWLHKFQSRAKFNRAKTYAKRLGLSLSQLLCDSWPKEPENSPRRFTHADRESHGLEIQITECDEFTRRALERQAAAWGCSVEEHILDGALCLLASSEESTFLDHQTGEVVDLKFGKCRGCNVDKRAAGLPASHFSRIPIPRDAIHATRLLHRDPTTNECHDMHPLVLFLYGIWTVALYVLPTAIALETAAGTVVVPMTPTATPMEQPVATPTPVATPKPTATPKAVATASPTPKPGPLHRINNDVLAAYSKEDFTEMIDMYAIQNTDGVKQMVSQGKVVGLRKGALVYLEAVDVRDGVVKVRPRGSAKTVWIPSQFLNY